MCRSSDISPLTPSRVCLFAPAGYSVQALTTGEGALGSLAKFSDNLASP